jgi:uncharacterized membrane protein
VKRALQVIFGLSLFGSFFSGILTYQELFGASAIACPAPGAAGTVLGYPACVYGFAMFVVITITAAIGLRAAREDADGDAGVPGLPHFRT